MGEVITEIKCDYCGKPAEFVTGQKIYPHRRDLWKLKFWQCEPCGAYVGCHRVNFPKGVYTNDIPLGRMANRELRIAKMKAHGEFDKYWKVEKIKRTECYEQLAIKMGINVEDCHIGMFTVEQCNQVVKICKEGLF